MKKLDTNLKKLEKVPSAVWGLLVAASYLFANLYSILAISEQMLTALDEQMSEVAMEFTGFANNLAWLYYIGTALAGLLVFEIILVLVYRFMYLRRYASTDVLHFKTVARVLYTAANVLVGLFGLLQFAIPQINAYAVYLFNYLVYTGAMLLMYLSLKQSVINPKYAGTALFRLFSFYFILTGGLRIYDFIAAAVVPNPDVHSLIAGGISLGLIAASAYLIYRFLIVPFRKAEKTFVEIIPPRNDDTPPPPDEIFRGYGF